MDVIGTDASGVSGLSSTGRDLLAAADLVALPRRLQEQTRAWLLETPSQRSDLQGRARFPELVNSDDPALLLEALKGALAEDLSVVLLASGDPLWFGIGRLLLQHLPAEQLRFHPAPTCLQLAFARIGRPWQDTSWISLHGRDPAPLAAKLQQRPPALAVLTDPGRGGAETVLRVLRGAGLEAAYRIWLCERLGHPLERVSMLPPGAAPPTDLDPLHLVLLVAEPPPLPDLSTLPLFGIEDGLWLQLGDRPGLMTKREVRIQLLADLDLPSRGILWDIGAGVGSIGLEALRLRPGLMLWALERRTGGAALIQANAERFGVDPTAVVEGEAPAALATFPDPDRVLLGGGGRLREVLLDTVLNRLRPGGVVVVPLATVEGVAELRPVMEAAGFGVWISQHQTWRGAPLADGTRLSPQNPVFVLKGKKPQQFQIPLAVGTRFTAP